MEAAVSQNEVIDMNMTSAGPLVEPAADTSSVPMVRSGGAIAPPRPSGVVTPTDLIQMALTQNAGLDQLERLMAMEERYKANAAREAFHEAMAKFKAKPITIIKDKHVGFDTKNNGRTEYNHATLGNVVKQVTAAMAECGLSHGWETELLEGGRIRVTCTVTHALGHSKSTSLEAGRDDSGGKNNIQALGSTVSYLQRYTLLALLGLATEEQDDDGAASGRRETAENPLLDIGRDKALDGTAALREWWEKQLTEAQRQSLVVEFRSLKQAAAKADKDKETSK